jgi:Tfp pilus assembly protein PilF
MSRYAGTRRRLLALVLIAAVTAVGCRTNPDVAKQEYVKSGDRFVEQKKYAEAIVQYRNAVQQDPRFGEARYKLAEAYAKTGDGRNAYREYIRAADLLPDNVDAQVKAATMLLMARQYEDAKTRAQKALAKDSQNVSAHIILGNSLAGLNDFESAIKQLEEANKLQPSAGAYTSIGAVQLARGARPDAEKAFREAVAVDPKNVGVHLAFAQYLMSVGKAAEAEASLKQALSLEPDNQLANRGLVAFLFAGRRGREAEPYLKKLAANDKSPGATQKLALAEYFAMTGR